MELKFMVQRRLYHDWLNVYGNKVFDTYDEAIRQRDLFLEKFPDIPLCVVGVEIENGHSKRLRPYMDSCVNW